MTSFENVCEIRGKNEAKRKLEVWRERLMRRFTKLADDVTPADCGLDFEGYLVTTITENHRTCNGVVGG